MTIKKTSKKTSKSTQSGSEKAQTVRKNVRALNALFVLAVVLLLLNTVGVFDNVWGSSTDERHLSWECARTACSAFMSEGELIDQACTQRNGTYICNVNINGQQRVVPLPELNLTNLNFCKKYVCVKEVQMRDVNYTVNVTTGEPIQ